MSVDLADQVSSRGITEVMHFTTSNGLIGILSTGALLAHSHLSLERRLEHILQLNCPDRSRDKAWHNYVNLSVSRINGSFFNISKNRWHASKDIYWCILSFSPEIVTHPGVVFSTTNNAYPTTKRGIGTDGFESLFAQHIRVYSKYSSRSKTTPTSHTTCHQAEVLYPDKVELRYLKKIYVGSVEILDEVTAQVNFLAPGSLDNFDIVVAPQHFL